MVASDIAALLTPTTFGRLVLANRVVMAPMTRARATIDGDPTELMAEYYRQRASAGMIVTEGIYPSDDGKGYCRSPGLVTPAQVAGWKTVTAGVHAEGGTIVAQVMHCGRVAHPDNKPSGARTVAPSAIAAVGKMYTDTDGGSMQAMPVPEALTAEEIPAVVEDYARCTELAYEAGFDGVELHATSGYLPAQFLSTGTNHRTDEYGGSVGGRIRFPVEVLRAMAAIDGADRVGLRIFPGNPFNDLHDDDPAETFTALLRAVEPFGLAYLHVIRMHDVGAPGLPDVSIDNLALAARQFSGPIVANDGYSPEDAAAAVEGGLAAISFARLFITNPDLPARIIAGDLRPFDARGLYNHGPEGYTDYPPLP